MSTTGANIQDPVVVCEAAPLLSEQEMSFYNNEKEVGKDGKENVKIQVSSAIPTRPWSTGLFDCMPGCASTEPGWVSTDWEICALGTLAPCVLHGSTSDRLHPAPSHFRESCSAYLALFCVGKLLTHSNVFAPCYSAGTRAAIRRKYHLKGSVEWLSEASGVSMGAPSAQWKEEVETAADCTVHWCCHSCALCQEAREARRQEPHPSMSACAMTAPVVQQIVLL